jgi:glucose-6-phosphate-specific signal transduction histidine kinase
VKNSAVPQIERVTWVKCLWRDVHFAVSETEAELEVKDYGKGIDPELLREFARTGGGAGLGLAGMRERIARTGWAIGSGVWSQTNTAP